MNLSLPPHEQAALQSFAQAVRVNYPGHVQQVVLFGSKARGDDTPASDIDLLVVLNTNDWRLRDTIRTLGARISLEYEVLLSIRAISLDKWAELARYQFPLYRAIHSEGIVLFSSDIN